MSATSRTRSSPPGRPSRPGGTRRGREAARRAAARRHRRIGAGAAAAIVVLAGLAYKLASGPASASAQPASAGQRAPEGTFTTVSGQTASVASLRGHPALLWFVSTWCSSCQAGTQAMAQNVATLAADGVRVVQIENYADLGQSGPPMGTFAKTLAGSAFTNPDWTFGEASSSLTHTYNPKAYTDLYYLINAEGKLTYVNSSPGSTMPQLLSAVKALA